MKVSMLIGTMATATVRCSSDPMVKTLGNGMLLKRPLRRALQTNSLPARAHTRARGRWRRGRSQRVESLDGQ